MGLMQNTHYISLSFLLPSIVIVKIVSKVALFYQNVKMELVLLSYNHLNSHVFLLVKAVMSLLCSKRIFVLPKP